MSKDWDYARHSQEVAAAGGIKKWLEAIKNNAYNQGHNDAIKQWTVPLITIGTFIGSISYYGYQKISEKREQKKKEIENATKAEILFEKELLKNNDCSSKTSNT